jgi:hypothetical protein
LADKQLDELGVHVSVKLLSRAKSRVCYNHLLAHLHFTKPPRVGTNVLRLPNFLLRKPTRAEEDAF